MWSRSAAHGAKKQPGAVAAGNPSTFEPMPSWQQGVGQNAGHSTRSVSDIAFDADPNSGALIIVDGVQQQYGGTSFASPLFAATWARVIAAQGTAVGFAAPLIYQLPSSAFHDVTSGNNGGETAAVGWDYTTDFGSMIVANVVNDIDSGGGGGGGGGGNAVPTASNGAVTTSENTAVSGTLSASDSDGDTLTFSIVSQPSHGSVTLTNTATGAFTYTPNSNYYGSDSFTFEATDSVGQASNTATESVTVNQISNAVPTASNGAVTTSENTAVSGTLSASDSDGDTLTFSIVSQPGHGSVTLTNTATGAFTYTPNSNYYGSDSFTFEATDSVGQASNTGYRVGYSEPGRDRTVPKRLHHLHR
jgi:subtilase family serine protease